MTCISITQFGGLMPEVAARNAGRSSAQIAHNCLLQDGVLRPMPQWKLYQVVTDGTLKNRIYEDTRNDVLLAMPEFRDAVYLTGKPFANNLLVGIDKNPGTVFGMTTNLRAAENADINALRPLGVPAPKFGTYITDSSVSYSSQAYSLKPVNRIIGVTFCRLTSSGLEESVLAVIPNQAPFGIMFEGDIVEISLTMSMPLCESAKITHVRLYRTISGLDTGEQVANELDTDWHLVETIAVRPIINYNDGGAVTTDPMDLYLAKHFYPPSFNAEHFGVTESGWFYMVSCDGKVSFSERYLHYAWPTENRYTLHHRVTDVVAHYDNIYVGTTKRPFVLAVAPGEGEQGQQAGATPFPERLPCLPRTMVVAPAGAIYAGFMGLVSLTKSGPRVITAGLTNPGDKLYTDADNNVVTIGKTTLGAYWEGSYFGFCGEVTQDSTDCEEIAPPETCGIPIAGHLPDGAVAGFDIYTGVGAVGGKRYNTYDTRTDEFISEIVVGGTGWSDMRIAPDNSKMYLYGSSVDAIIYVVDLATNAVVATIDTTMENSDGNCCINAAGTEMWAMGVHQVARINLVTQTVTNYYTTDGHAFTGCCFSADEQYVYAVSTAGSNLARINTTTGVYEIMRSGAGIGGRGVVLDSDPGYIWITVYESSIYAAKISTEAPYATVESMTGTARADYIVTNPSRTRAYITFTNGLGDGGVQCIDIVNVVEVFATTVGTMPQQLVVTPDGLKVYVANRGEYYVSVLDAVTGDETTQIVIPQVGHGLIAGTH